jgi:GxxExxY protein
MYLAEEYPYQDQTYQLIGIALEIHHILGKGFLEIVYKDAFELELIQHAIPYEREKEFKIDYKGTILKHFFYADFVIDNKVILELKSKKGVIDEHYAQVLNYLAISKLQVGLIINFHENLLQKKRIVLSK